MAQRLVSIYYPTQTLLHNKLLPIKYQCLSPRFLPLLLPYRNGSRRKRGDILTITARRYHQHEASKEQPKDTDKSFTTSSIEDQLKNLKEKARDIRIVINDYWKQFSVQYRIAKTSLDAANKKFEEEERTGKIPKLNFDTDEGHYKGNSETINGNGVGLSQRELHRRRWKRKIEYYVDSLQETIGAATKTLNDITGYSSIQKLRNRITVMENELSDVKTDVKRCKVAYETAVEMRTRSQREVNELLQRKNVWTPDDLARFTKLYKDDALNSKKEQELKQKLSDLEDLEDKASNELYKAILIRYHEEQIWSDKIRRTSTWGTFILTVVNTCFFLVLQLLLEPYKRWRLTRAFENKVKLALEEYSLEQGREKDIEVEVKTVKKPELQKEGLSEEPLVSTLQSETPSQEHEPQIETPMEPLLDGGTETVPELSPDLQEVTPIGNEAAAEITANVTANTRPGIFSVFLSIQDLWYTVKRAMASLSKKLWEPRSELGMEPIVLTSGELSLYSVFIFAMGSIFGFIV